MFRRILVRFDSPLPCVSKLSTNHHQAHNLKNTTARTPWLLDGLDKAHVIDTFGLTGIKPTEVPHNRPAKVDGLSEALQNRLTTPSFSAKVSSSTQAQTDIDSLLRESPMLKDLPPLSHMNLSKQSFFPTHHRWLLNLGTLNDETIWCGLGPPQKNLNKAPHMCLHLGKIGLDMPQVRSKELENVAYVEPFKTLWQKIETLESSDEKRGRMKGLTHWYFLQQAADKGEHFKLYENIKQYILRTMNKTSPIVQTKSDHRPPVLRIPSSGHELHPETSGFQVEIIQKELVFDLLKGDFEEYASLKRKCEALDEELQETKRAANSKKKRILQFIGVGLNSENWYSGNKK